MGQKVCIIYQLNKEKLAGSSKVISSFPVYKMISSRTCKERSIGLEERSLTMYIGNCNQRVSGTCKV